MNNYIYNYEGRTTHLNTANQDHCIVSDSDYATHLRWVGERGRQVIREYSFSENGTWAIFQAGSDDSNMRWLDVTYKFSYDDEPQSLQFIESSDINTPVGYTIYYVLEHALVIDVDDLPAFIKWLRANVVSRDFLMKSYNDNYNFNAVWK